MKRVIATGRTVEEAVTSALVRLGATRSQATVRVIAEPTKGLFGFIRTKDAEVEVTVNQAPDEAGKDFLSDLLSRMGVDSKVRARQVKADGNDEVRMEISCDEDRLPIVIGKHGTTLDAIQYLVNIVGNRGNTGFTKFVVDAGDYRQRRKEGLCRIAERAALRAIKTGKPVLLDAMSSSDRKVIHTFLQNRSDVSTTSEGVDPNRRVKIIPHSRSHAMRAGNRNR
jgi:spoIIIJ-associated protein